MLTIHMCHSTAVLDEGMEIYSNFLNARELKFLTCLLFCNQGTLLGHIGILKFILFIFNTFKLCIFVSLHVNMCACMQMSTKVKRESQVP